MTSRILITIIGTVLINVLSAQNTNDHLTNVKAPSAPAAAIIGTQPSTISRPKSWESLETSLFSNFLDSSNRFLIPDNYSLEFSPYWASGRKISNAEFLAPSVGTSFKQNLSVSLSSTKNYIINDSIKSNALGIGVRTMLWQGTKDEIDLINNTYSTAASKLQIGNAINATEASITYPANCNKDTVVQRLSKAMESRSNAIFNGMGMTNQQQLDWIAAYKSYLSDNLPEDIDYTNQNIRDSKIDEITDTYTAIDRDIQALEKLRSDRQGWKLEIATAMAFNFPTDRTDFCYGSKFGFWLTPSFQPSNPKLQCIEFLGVMRYYWYNQNFCSRYLPGGKFFENNFDYGFKTVIKKNKISLELEATGRISSFVLSRIVEPDESVTKKTNTKYDRQLIATLTYTVNENVSISYNFGRAFKPSVDYDGNLVSMATINFGLGAPRRTDVK